MISRRSEISEYSIIDYIDSNDRVVLILSIWKSKVDPGRILTRNVKKSKMAPKHFASRSDDFYFYVSTLWAIRTGKQGQKILPN